MQGPLKILEELFHWTDVEVQKLDGYENENFLVTKGQERFVLKTYPSSPEMLDLIQAQNQVLSFLLDSFPKQVPKPIHNQKGVYLSTLGDKAVRMLTYLDGELLGKVDHSPELFSSLGTFLGQLDKKLANFRHPILEARQYHWDLQYFLHNEPLTIHIRDPHHRKLVEHFFLQYKAHVLPKLPRLRKQIVHGDANEWNLLTSNGTISGIIDFGDLCYSAVIHDLAIALTYALLGKNNPLEWAMPIVSAYHKAYPLLQEETDLLYYLIAARLCTSVCNSTYDQAQDPQNTYISSSQNQAWELLKVWIIINPLDAQKVFSKAIG